MLLQFATRLQRPLVALFCAQIVVCAAGPNDPQSVHSVIARMPNGPNFWPPSAVDCARPVQVEESQRIQTSANPIDTITGEEMRRLGIVSVADALSSTSPAAPAALPELDPTFGSRTLTLVDGRRIVSSSNQADVVDLNMIPPTLLQRMDVVTGGASAASGLPPPPAPRARMEPVRPATEPVTAGMVDDNANFNDYLGFRYRTQVQHRELDISVRHLLQVRDARGAVIPDAEVVVRAANGVTMWARTDAGGRAWLHPRAFDPSNSQIYEVTASKNGRQGTAFLQRGQNAPDSTWCSSSTPPDPWAMKSRN
jgi:hypothetical protein